MADKLITHKRTTPTKKRSQSAYNNKVNKITKWYNHLLKCRENPKGDNLINPNTHKEVIKKCLKSLDYYLNLLRKPKE